MGATAPFFVMLVTFSEARTKGLRHYFTGKPCSRGHIAERFVTTRNCVECNKERGRIENITEAQRVQRNKLQSERYWLDYENKRRQNTAAVSKWQKNNSETVLAKTRVYQLKKKNALPQWADLEAIKQFYENCPVGFEVDHIIPIQHELVCGLHVLENLQYLTIVDNRRKGNYFEVF